MKLGQMLVKQIRGEVFGGSFKDIARKSSKDFTRNRKMPLEGLIIYMITSLKCSTASSLRRFFACVGMAITMRQQSLSDARAKVKVEAFTHLFNVTAQTMTENCSKKWHGYRVNAIDGSKITLPTDKKLLKYYGGLGKDKTAPTAQASILYDVLNDIVADAAIAPLSTDERTLAKNHLKACVTLDPDGKKLIIFDRGYASFELIEMLEQMGIHYVFRVKRAFNADIDAQSGPDGYVVLKKDAKHIHVRVIKFMLDSGEEEVLVTNITDKRLGKNAFKKLYFMRWPVETKYDLVKNKLQLENFNTRTVEGIQQDFYAIMLLSNIAASAVIDVQDDIDSERKDKNNKYRYKANMNELIGILKDRLVFALIQDTPDIQAKIIDSIYEEIKNNVIPIKPNRSVIRNKNPRKSKFHHNQKANC